MRKEIEYFQVVLHKKVLTTTYLVTKAHQQPEFELARANWKIEFCQATCEFIDNAAKSFQEVWTALILLLTIRVTVGTA